MKSRTSTELKELMEQRKAPNASDETVPSNIEDIKAKKENELASLSGKGSICSIKADFGQGIKSDKVETLKSTTQDELLALKENVVNMKNLAVEFDAGVQSAKVEEVKARTVEELAMLKGIDIRERAAAVTTPVVATPKSKVEIKSRAAEELANLQKEKGSSPKDPVDETSGQQAVWIKSDSVEKIKSKTAADLASLKSSGSSLRQRADEMSRLADLRKGRGVSQEIKFSETNIEKIRSRTTMELEQLRAKGI